MIPTSVKCKRKLEPDGSYDKHKTRTAARGDLLVRKLIRLGMDLPDTFSPTIRTLTFLLVLQIAIAKGLKCATQDIKHAYLNADIPESDVPIITKLHPLVANKDVWIRPKSAISNHEMFVRPTQVRQTLV